MASPVDAGRNTTSVATAADPWTVNLPASIAAGDLLVVLGRTGSAATHNLPSSWTWLVQNNASDASDDNVSIIYRWADGSEGSTLSWDLSTTAKGAAIAWRITGAADPASQVPETALLAYTGTNPDPPALSPTGGSKDYLFLALVCSDGEAGIASGAPSGYSNLTTANSSVVGTTDTNVLMGGASRQATTATENPGVWTNGQAANGGLLATLAVHPPGAAAPTFVPQIVIVG